ncbi:histidine kinase [Roseibium marinum]|uniref:HAMP domain-containing protein n=1 Tax=Roseibium marinum TaxID=281252 RepID=A0A2S3V4E4_9HYPH|nr:histidine kinase [Roseibium marinum]POF34806.1 HAMP domain-containing protein [Roseibium marinum]
MRRLLPQLVLRVLAAQLVTVLLGASWILWATADAAREDARVTAERVAVAIAARPDFMGLAFGGVAPVAAFRDWQDFPRWTLIAPGICVEFGANEEPDHRRCGSYLAAVTPPPLWFQQFAERIGLIPAPVTRPVRSRGVTNARVTAIAEPDVIIARAWDRIGYLMRLAFGMAVGGALLTGLLVARLLLPFRTILRSIERLQSGDFSTRQPRQSVAEFDRLGLALNDTANALQEAQDTRTDLTRRLFTVQESERRALARELHDEFGQCLTATRALATAVAQSGETTARDGVRIAEISGQMMQSLRSELSRLRPPDLDELGLDAALQRLVAGWRGRLPSVRFALDLQGDIDAVPDDLALSLYRITQECLTNAIRHGEPKAVTVSLEAGDGIFLTVSDDGGARGELPAGDGYGLLGIRERVYALGGSFTLTPLENGMRARVHLEPF